MFPPLADNLAASIDGCMLADRHRLRVRLRELTRRGGAGGRPRPPSDAAADQAPPPSPKPRADARPGGRGPDSLEGLAADIARARARRDARLAHLPKPTYPPELPVVQRKAEIAAAIAAHQVVVVCGETGSGKTTQLPKVCLELGRGVDGLIGHTQPRRIAARSVAARLSDELGSPPPGAGAGVGGAVGYKVRFADTLGPQAYVKLMTDGILLAETQGDRFLEQYDTLIIDEAHERSLNIDFLLGYLKQLLPRRPDLKLIITSATIDPQRFAAHFAPTGGPTPGSGAPIIEVSGRTYPVEVRYRPPVADADAEGGGAEDTGGAVVRALDELAQVDPRGGGDVLVFLSGERDIRDTAEAIRRHYGMGERPLSTGPGGIGTTRRQRHRVKRIVPGDSGGRGHLSGHAGGDGGSMGSGAIGGVEILPLYARLSAEEQGRVFKPTPPGVRRIVLATNVAETSLTVPGIRYVIDPGLARISRYSPRTRVQRLPIEAVSRASADQRAGRCGRVAAGVCIRLYSEEDYLARPRFTEPEVLRTNLASVILQMKALRLGDVEAFPFLEPPEPRMIRDGYATLHELGAVDERNDLTGLGRELARLPLDPRIGRMILAAREENVLPEVLVLAAALSVQDPRERPLEKQEAADQAHTAFRDEGSDFLGYLKLWEAYHAQLRATSKSQARKWCGQHFLSWVRMREWIDVHQQLRGLVEEMGAARGPQRGNGRSRPPRPARLPGAGRGPRPTWAANREPAGRGG